MLVVGLGGCGSSPTPEDSAPPSRADIEAQFARANQLSASRSQLQIEGYIRRQGLTGLTRDGTGVYYRVTGTAIGPSPREEVGVAIAYRAELLDGRPCGSADTVAPLEFTIGRRDQPAGLETLVQHMAPGQQALGIVPAHLAYGLAGDGKRIPPNSCVVYRIEWLRYTREE